MTAFTTAIVTWRVPGTVKPQTPIRIDWDVEGIYSGSTVCEAWAAQVEIDRLEEAGYSILAIGLA